MYAIAYASWVIHPLPYYSVFFVHLTLNNVYF